MGSNRNFGLVFSVVFIILGFFPLIKDSNPNFWLIVISLLFLFFGIFIPNVLKPLNILWFKFGILLGTFVSPIIMLLIFYLIITPIGIIMKIFGKDLLNLKYDKKKNTYWIKRESFNKSMKRQF